MHLAPVTYTSLADFRSKREGIVTLAFEMLKLAGKEDVHFITATETDAEPITRYTLAFDSEHGHITMVLQTDLELGLVYMCCGVEGQGEY